MTTIIDTHLHIILPDRFDYLWMENIQTLAGQDWPTSRFVSENKTTIGHAIFMECDVVDSQYKNEARYFSALAQDRGHALIGVVASCRPEEAQGFEAWIEECVELETVGFRRVLHVQPDELSQSPIFRKNINLLGHYSKPFDLCILQNQFPIAYDLASTCHDTVFVLDHCGVSDIAEGDFETWKRAIKRMSELENVMCKLSGLLAFCGSKAPNYETLQPYLEWALEVFGQGRLVWGSDWPIVHLGGGLKLWTDYTQAFFGTLSEHERRSISTTNAIRIYGLGHRLETGRDTP